MRIVLLNLPDKISHTGQKNSLFLVNFQFFDEKVTESRQRNRLKIAKFQKQNFLYTPLKTIYTFFISFFMGASPLIF
jgi:hypothetical protein